MNKSILSLALLIGTGCACSPAPEAEGDPGNDIGPPRAESCPADRYQGFVGSELAAISYPSDLDARVIRPGEMHTMEYDPDRMNIEIDEDGVVTRVYCG